MTIFGTRPEIIRLSTVMPLLDSHSDHVMVHTGQNHDPALSEIFFRELGLRAPDHYLDVRASSFAEQAAKILARTDELLIQHKPDRVLILGDTNSALSSIVAKRRGIPVFHMEAGNRCFDDRVPEEINRRIIDHASDVLLPYTESSRANLLREGIPSRRIFVTGNPIYEVLHAFDGAIEDSNPLERLGLTPRGYVLVTLHRAENVDDPERLQRFIAAFRLLASSCQVPVVVSTHPRLRARMGNTDLTSGDVRFMPPFGFFEFVKLQKNARCVATDSGTVQEEATILRVPVVTLRDVTERPETLENGANTLTGADPERIVSAVGAAVELGTTWSMPAGYTESGVSRAVVRLVTGYWHKD